MPPRRPDQRIACQTDLSPSAPPTARVGERIYVRAQHGHWQRVRRTLGWLATGLFLGLPWLRWQGEQALLIDIGRQQMRLFSLTLWPQDLPLLTGLLAVAAFALFAVTSRWGRVWCGYLCPQTVWTFWYLWVEEKCEGAANKRRARDAAPWDADKLKRKALKHTAWLAIALLTALTFVSYFLPAPTLWATTFSGQLGGWPTFWLLLFTLCTYANAGWLRNIMCLHMCPYARFQSAMFERHTVSVNYDAQRGEPRGAPRRAAAGAPLGDCIDCDLCVQVCPAGIDIRAGLQYGCINCGACVDACDHTMARQKRPLGLIRYTSAAALAGQTPRFGGKTLGYAAALLLMLGALAYQALLRAPLTLEVLRDRLQLYRETDDGGLENTYTLKLRNKTQRSATYQLAVTGLPTPDWQGAQQVTLQPGELRSVPVTLRVDPARVRGSQAITFSVSYAPEKDVTHASRFLAP
ncbi:MAG: cytochrome c oxidase accessory protein CcoG [Aeromonas sp.]